MARVFISGSSTGLGLMAGQLLIEQGHEVVLHARNAQRAAETRAACPRASAVVEGDVATVTAARSVAEQVNRLGRFDAVIHNVAVGYDEPRRDTTDGLPHVFAINTLAPYILTALIERPRRLVYLSSGLHRGVEAHLDDLAWKRRPWNAAQAYSETKLHDAMLAFAMARLWPDVLCNAVEPGWVATRMGGPGATDKLDEGHRTQAWLAVSEEPAARVTGGYFYHQRPRDVNPLVRDANLQDQLLQACGKLSGIIVA